MVATENTKLERTDLEIPAKIAPPLAKLTKLSASINALRFKLNMAKGEEAVAAAKLELEAAQKNLKQENEKLPSLYHEVLDKHADFPQVIEAASLDLADKAAKLLTDKTPVEMQVRILKALQSAQEKAGKADLAKLTAARLLKLEEQLDKEYLAKVPPFKPTKFQARKKESTRVAVLELFTGAYCPPCVAADVAFDGLLKAYKPTELVMIQYHMHIPAPDPLTNPDTEARHKYYGGEAGVPSALFNGKRKGDAKQQGGGGGMTQSEAKFKQYRGFIDPILDEENTIKLGGKVATKGDKLAITIDVDGIKEGADPLKLRIVVVEEAVKYVGGNGIRYHHHVARAMPGGPDGIALEKNGSKTAEVDLTDVRKKLKSYLDDFVKESGEFGNPDMPLALKNLRVIAFVQDDANKQILQAVQLDVADAK